jgi:hypothetical protein
MYAVSSLAVWASICGDERESLMVDRKRAARWRGWAVAFVAILGIAASAWGILVALGAIFPSYPQIVGKNCGTITAGERGTAGDFAPAEQCLWKAYETCQAATLIYHNAGLDFTETHAVSVQKHRGTCSVTDATQGKQDEGFGQPARHSYPCSGMQQQPGGLVIVGCGTEGNVPIPASQSQCSEVFWKCL